MPDLLLRRNAVVKAYPDEFLVILPMADGYELQVGHISKQVGARQREFWQWAGPGGVGRSDTREAAMVDLKAAWDASEQDLADMRRDQESTEWKYVLWDAGRKAAIADGVIHCPCGARFDPQDHEATRAHIEHIKKGRPARS